MSVVSQPPNRNRNLWISCLSFSGFLVFINWPSDRPLNRFCCGWLFYHYFLLNARTRCLFYFFQDDNSGVAVKTQRKQGQAPKKKMFRRRMSGLYPTAKKLSKPVHVTYPCLENKNEMIVSPEERSRFSKALESINKKILSQNLVWTNFLSWDFSKTLFKESAHIRMNTS